MKSTEEILVHAVIETTKGSCEKFAYEPESGFFLLKKILPPGMVFPYDFGFIQGTKGQDGDPLDIMILSEFHSFPGCLMECRLLGGIKAEQGKKNEKKIRNDRYLAIPKVSKAYNDIATIKHLPADMIKALEDFFVNYNKEEGKVFEALGYVNAKKAIRQIRACQVTK